MVDFRVTKLGRWLGRWLVAAAILARSTALAILFHSTGDPAYNTTPPTGSLTNSGWQFQGDWGAFLGTPISPHHFITAAHVGGSIGDPFRFNGESYLAADFFDDPQTDLRIWRVCGSFPSFAPRYSGTNEVGRDLVVFGRGTQRGAEIRVGDPVPQVHGWTWGAGDGLRRFGENRVSQIVEADNPPAVTGVGQLLAAAFDAQGGANECTVSGGDSGGGVFIRDGAEWRLAGVNYAVDSPFSLTAGGEPFYAALFDRGGLYEVDSTNYVLIPNRAFNLPGRFYATRISSRSDWIESVLAAPIPPDSDPILQAAGSPAGPFVDLPGATLQRELRTIVTPRVAEVQFYRVRSCRRLRLTEIHWEGESLHLRYGDGETSLPTD